MADGFYTQDLAYASLELHPTLPNQRAMKWHRGYYSDHFHWGPTSTLYCCVPAGHVRVVSIAPQMTSFYGKLERHQ
ncbi:hypothetical protein N7509_013532 [Penicillium cosmopolitanum]|uniref:Uncharacterized protein n=1 Tax=Penicillium cosmopolitanum TaxID=1131564 RepID=A0A9W9VEQ5_9EURO|nr:uncharacterized protein N7509_013532 [Penicillium cosmopolitanum]KAJ5376646.1 hypothetical protein N7509_013532 [Penicillium cosmopolitanum]